MLEKLRILIVAPLHSEWHPQLASQRQSHLVLNPDPKPLSEKKKKYRFAGRGAAHSELRKPKGLLSYPEGAEVQVLN